MNQWGRSAVGDFSQVGCWLLDWSGGGRWRSHNLWIWSKCDIRGWVSHYLCVCPVFCRFLSSRFNSKFSSEWQNLYGVCQAVFWKPANVRPTPVFSLFCSSLGCFWFLPYLSIDVHSEDAPKRHVKSHGVRVPRFLDLVTKCRRVIFKVRSLYRQGIISWSSLGTKPCSSTAKANKII